MSRESEEDIRKIRIELEDAREQREREQRDQSNEGFGEALGFVVVLILTILSIFTIGRPFRDMFSSRINRIIDITGISLLFIGFTMIYVWWSLSNDPYSYIMFNDFYPSVFWDRYETTYGWYGFYILIVAGFLCGSSRYLPSLDKMYDQVSGPISPDTLTPKVADSLTSVYEAGRPFRARFPNWMNKVIDYIGLAMVFLMLPALFININYVILLGIAAGFILISSPNRKK